MNYTYTIEQDTSPESPREWDNLGTMVLFHPRYAVPNESDYRTEDFASFKAMGKQILKDNPNAILLAVRMYDHSGVWFGTRREYPFTDLWDSMPVGFIYVSLDTIRKEYGVKRVSRQLRARVSDMLNNEVKTYSAYSSGAVFGYVVKDRGGEVVDSCWGFYEFDYCEQQAKEVVDGLEKELLDESA